jgi:hypothetical protein
MIGETQAAQLIPTVVNRGFFHRCYFLPFLPSWKVPKFIRTCDAVCFLERDFPVAIHGPVVPREVLACGTCLVLSGEIVDKQLDGNEFITGKNFVRVDDPRDTEELEDRLHQLIQNRSAAVNIGSRGSQIPKAGEGYREFVESWESIFGEAARRREHPVERLAPSGSVDQTQIDPLLLYAPIFRSVLVDHASALINEFAMDIRPSSPLRAGIELCSFLSDRLSGTTGPNDLAKLRDALKYQRARIQSVLDAADDSPPFVVVDQLRDNLITADTVDHLRPVGGNSAQVVELDFDITPLFTLSSVTEPVNLRDLKRDPMFVLFQHTANSQQKELKINSATYKLFTRCDGTLTTGELVRALSAELGSDSADVRMGIYGALATLHREGVIVFGERMPGWGWTGGARWT